jgi:CMP-N-acetylneuraminic acid synthetase
MTPYIAALVPMRADSTRVPGKNYRSFAGIPLYHHVLSTLLSVPLIDVVVIDTDSDFIRTDAAEHFPSVLVLDRPEHLRAGDISMNEVLLNTVSQIAADWYVQTHSTNPLLSHGSVATAIQRLLDTSGENDSLFSVTRLSTRLWTATAQPINHNPDLLLRTQDLPPIFEENSNLYIFTASSLQATRNRIGKSPLLFELPRVEAWDIDEEADFVIAEFLYHRAAL